MTPNKYSHVVIRVGRFILVRFGDNWFCYDSWRDLFRDLNPTDKLYIQVVPHAD